MLARLSLRTRVFLLFLALGGGTLAALGLGLWFALHRNGDPSAANAAVRVALAAGFLMLSLIAGIGYLFDLHLAKALERLAGAVRARANAGVAKEIDTTGLAYLGSITDAVSEAAVKLTQARSALAETVARETARLSAEKSQLEHLLSDVPPGVLLCTGRHHLVFYNGAAQQLLDNAALPLCLDKNLFDYLADGPVRHAHRRLLETGSAVSVVELVCTTHGQTRRLAARMRLVGEGSADPAAYVMTLRDVTDEISAGARRDALLSEIFDEVLPAFDPEPPMSDRPPAHAPAHAPANAPGGDAAARLAGMHAALSGLAARFEAMREDRATPLPVLQQVSNRFVVYDFELLARLQAEKIIDARLDDLTYVVFDTETTGLLPDQGDEIVQIAAVRIVNGKRVRGEVFDMLVNPGRSIPASSTAVHGVSEAMVRDAPGVVSVLERFRVFSQGAVLVAHNAPFDMEFLRRRERALGGRFDNPILDTVLLSAVVFGQAEAHTLDALAARLGLTIGKGERHTAIGDAMATADVFLRLKDMLAGKGIIRFGDILKETRRHRRLLKDLN
jgi:DNA polymerase III subunit epsilon